MNHKTFTTNLENQLCEEFRATMPHQPDFVLRGLAHDTVGRLAAPFESATDQERIEAFARLTSPEHPAHPGKKAMRLMEDQAS